MLEDVRHASPPPEASGSQTTLSVVVQAEEVPEVVKKRMFKGPLGSYALHHDRIAFNFVTERERLEKDYAQALALSARYEWLKRLVDWVHEKKKEKSPEIEAEWFAVREAKTRLQESHNKSRMHTIAADAATVLPVWQTPVRVPENLRSNFNRVQDLGKVQSLISEAAAKRLAELRELEDLESLVKQQRKAIRLKERAIVEKLRELPSATYERDRFTCLKITCSVDKVRYPQADTFVETIAKYYRSAESSWNEVKGTLDEIRMKMAECVAKVQKNPAYRVSNEMQGYKVTLGQYELVLKQELENCRKQCASTINGKADYLASLGLATPEVKKWVERAQEELDERLGLLRFELIEVKSVLDTFTKELEDYADALQKIKKEPAKAPVPVEPSRGLFGKLFTGAPRAKSSPAIYGRPEAIQWQQVSPVPLRHCLSALMPNAERIKAVMPSQDKCRDLSQIPQDKWTLVDRWKNGLEVLLPKVAHLLANDLLPFNRSLFRLQIQVAFLEQFFKGPNAKMDARLIHGLRETSNALSKQREELRGKKEAAMPTLHILISEMEQALAGKKLTTSTEVVDVEARQLQELMREALHELAVVEGLAVAAWSAGDDLHKVTMELEKYPVSDVGKIDPPIDPLADAIERQALNVFDAFSIIMTAKDGPERTEKLNALEAEGAKKERLKLDGLAQKFREESEKLDGLINHVLTIYANWAHLDNLAKGIKDMRSIPQTDLPGVLIIPLLKFSEALTNAKSDIEAYAPVISNALKGLRHQVFWQTEKLNQEMQRWRADQEGFYMRTPEGNQERNQQLEQEIGKYTQVIAALEVFWKAGEEKCGSFLASLNVLHERKEGRKGTLISETPYQTAVKVPAAPVAAAVPASEAEKMALHRGWMALTGDDDGDFMNFSQAVVALGEPSQPAVPPAEKDAAPAAPPSEEPLNLSALAALEQAVKGLPSQGEAAALVLPAVQPASTAALTLPALQPASTAAVVPLKLAEHDNP